MIIADALDKITSELINAGIESPELDARVLLAHVLDINKYRLITDGDKKLSKSDYRKYSKLAQKRKKNIPVAYITGKKEFYSLDFIVTKDVLIPRPETEQIVEIAVTAAGTNCSVLDIGTGSGAIAIAIKKNRPDLEVFACDISHRSLKISKKNAEKILGSDCIAFYKSDLFSAFGGRKFDIIVSNPPYLNIEEKNYFQKEILHEPSIALFTADSGMEILNRIIKESGKYLSNNGLLIMEFGSGQDILLRETAAGDYSVSIYNDYAGLPRIAVLQKKEVT